MRGPLLLLAITLAAALARPALALDASAVGKLASEGSDEKIEGIAALVAEGDPRAIVVLQALADGELQAAGKRMLIVKGDSATDAVTGGKVAPLPAEREEVMLNNRLRSAIQGALAALKLTSTDRSVRLAAARELAGGAEEAMLPLLKRALDKESDPAIRPLLEQTAATLELKSGSKESRI